MSATSRNTKFSKFAYRGIGYVVAAFLCTGSFANLASAQSTNPINLCGVGGADGAPSGNEAIWIQPTVGGSGGSTGGNPCISNQTIQNQIDAAVQASGGGTPGANSVGSVQIVDGSVTGTDIADGSVTGTDIADGTVTGDDIQDGSVTGTDIADGSITQSDLASNSVGSAQIIDQSVTQADLADSSVGSAQIIDNSVTSADIENGTIQNEDIAAGAVNSESIENDSILLEDLNGEVRQYINSGNSNTLTQANNYTDRRVNELQQQVNRNADIANDGVAMALAAQVPTLSEGTVQAVTIGYGYYSGSSAISIGGTTRIEDTDWQAFGTLGYGFKAEKFGLSVGLLWSR